MEFMISEIQSETFLLLTRVNLPYRGCAMTEFCGQQWPIKLSLISWWYLFKGHKEGILAFMQIPTVTIDTLFWNKL